MTTTATIETLTAEVRTLVVGSRQITLSVAKQLDSVPLHELTVMGRVRLSAEQHTVIGTATDGSLATANYSPRLWLDQTWDMKLRLEAKHLAGSNVIVCGNDLRYNSAGDVDYGWAKKDKLYYKGSATLMPIGSGRARPTATSARRTFDPTRDREVWVSVAATEPCGVDHRTGAPRCDWALGDRDVVEAELLRQHLDHCRVVKLHQEAAAAPLIVLAGLR